MIRAAADRVAVFGHPLFLRPLWEMNGNWEAYNETNASSPGTKNGGQKYIFAWRRIYNIFQQEGGTNAAFVWCPNVRDVPATTANHWTKYYPGDAYVNWVSADGYNFGITNGGWRSFQTLFTPLYNAYPGKPFLVAETASVEQGGSKGRSGSAASNR